VRSHQAGNHTDYVARQYLGRLGKVDNGIVSVNIYGLKDGIVFPLIFEIYKPKQRLQPGDKYQSKPQIAVALVKELVKLGLKIKRVLADSLYGESSTNLIGTLEELKLQFMVSIRSNHGGWMLKTEKADANRAEVSSACVRTKQSERINDASLSEFLVMGIPKLVM
jgi:SRSO17 transposase